MIITELVGLALIFLVIDVYVDLIENLISLIIWKYKK
jgi:hypothetical protein